MTITIAATGDISLGDHPVRAGYGMRAALARHGSSLISDVAECLKGNDIVLGNLETVASNSGFRRYWLPSYEMRGDPSKLHILREAGFNLVTVANNHAMQHGLSAFQDSQKHIENEGIRTIGLDENGRTTTHIAKKHDSTACFIAFSLRPEQWKVNHPPYSLRKDLGQLIREIRDIRAAHNGCLVCSIHWGLEFLHSPTPLQVYLGRSLVDAGVDVVLGHHPHVLQPIERYKSGLIFYSLGNFLFDLWPSEMRHSIIAHVTLAPNQTPQYHITPIFAGDDLVVRHATAEQTRFIKRIINAKVGPTPDRAQLEQMESLAEARYRQERKAFRYNSYRFFLRNILKAPIHLSLQQLGRTAIRRLTRT